MMAALYLDGVRIQTSNMVLYETSKMLVHTKMYESESCFHTRHLAPNPVPTTAPTTAGCTKTVFMYPCKRESIRGKRASVVLTDDGGTTTTLLVKQGCCIKKPSKAESKERMLPLRWEDEEGGDRRVFELEEEDGGGGRSGRRVCLGSLHCAASTHEWLGIVVEST